MTHQSPPATVPISLSGPLAAVVDSGCPHDFLVEGIPFLLGPSEQDPYVRDWADDQKEQFDNSNEAGENSFGTWWLRSQATFHGGSGQKFLDSAQSELSRARFYDSTRAYVHTPGEVTIDSGINKEPVITGKGAVQVSWSAVNKVAFMSTSTSEIKVYNCPAMTGLTTIAVGAVGVPAAMCSDGTRIFVAINDRIYRIDSGGAVTQIYNANSFTGPVNIAYVKERLIATIGPSVYELSPAPAGPPVAWPAAHYVNKAADWQYTAITDGPTGIYLAGYSGQSSHLSQMTITESAGTLVMGQPTVQLALPPAELIHDAFSYINSFVVLATSQGARVASFTPYGQLQLGPLSIDGDPCYAVSAGREQVFVGGTDEIWRIDLATPIDEAGRYAAARKTSGFGQTVNEITVFPADQPLVFGTFANGNAFWESSFVGNVAGTLTTSWVRFGTIEPKQLHYVRVDGDFDVMAAGFYSCTVKVETDSGDSVTFNIAGGEPSYEFSTSALPAAQQFRLVFSLDQASGTTALTGYQLKALPVQQRLGEYILPLMCNDRESPKEGGSFGYEGFAMDRLQQLEGFAATQRRITVYDRALGESFQGVIRRCQYRQTGMPAILGERSGLVNLVLRRV